MRKKISISEIILLSLEKTVDGYIRFEDFTYHYYRYHYGIPKLKKSSLAQALRRLRLDGYINLENYNKQLVFRLTEIGKTEAELRKILRDENWDGKWRIVVFDIPEKNKKIRDTLRGRLKSWGFIQWQKSVWASQKKVAQILRQLVKDLGIEKWVLIIELSDTGVTTNY